MFDMISDSLFGLEKANAVPTGDWLRASISNIFTKKYGNGINRFLKHTKIFQV